MLEIILPVLYIALFIFLILKINFFHLGTVSPHWLVLVFILKIICGTTLWFIYTHMYPDRSTADIFKYFDDGKIIYSTLFTNPADYFKMLFAIPDPSLNHYYLDDMRHWTREFGFGLYNENRTLIRFNALVDVFSFGNYHVHTVVICFLSTIGLAGIYKSFIPFLAKNKRELFVAVFLIPSVLFWGSGVLKEGLVLFSLGMCIYHYFKLVNEKIFMRRLFIFSFFAFLLALSKFYVLIAILPAFVAHLLIAKTNYSFPAVKYLFVFVFIFFLGMIIPKYHFPYMLRSKQHQAIYMARGGSYLGNEAEKKFVYIGPEIKNRIIKLNNRPGFCKIVPGISYVSWGLDPHADTLHVKNSADTLTYWIYYDQSAAGSYIEIPFIEGTILSILKNTPLSFINAAFRPNIFEAKNPLMMISAAENLLIIIFILICIIFYSKKKSNKQLIYFCLCFTFLLFALIGITTPILGAIVRYKIPAIPFFLIAFLLMLDKEKLLNKLPFLKKILG